jgi:hypothetical protein
VVPDQAAGFISYIVLVAIEYFWNKGWRLQIIPL